MPSLSTYTTPPHALLGITKDRPWGGLLFGTDAILSEIE
jgi:hypothetical protein